MSGRKKSRRIKDIVELLYHEMSCNSSVMRAEMITPYFDENQEDTSQCYQVKLELFAIEGPYRNGHFTLILNISKDYPFKGPTFFVTEPLWHPNIDLQTGQVYLPIEWSPVIKLVSIVFALQLLFLEPSDETIVNYEAGQLNHSNPSQFDSTVQSILHGGMINGILYPNYILKGQTCWYANQMGHHNFQLNGNHHLRNGSPQPETINKHHQTKILSPTTSASDWLHLSVASSSSSPLHLHSPLQSNHNHHYNHHHHHNNRGRKRNHSNLSDMMSQEEEEEENCEEGEVEGGEGREGEEGEEEVREYNPENETNNDYYYNQNDHQNYSDENNQFNQWTLTNHDKYHHQRHDRIEWYSKGRKKRSVLTNSSSSLSGGGIQPHFE